MAKIVKPLKRPKLSKEDCLVNVGQTLPLMFHAFKECFDMYNEQIQQFIPEVRTRLDSTLFYALLAQSFIKHFPESYRKGRYKRAIFRFEGCQMILKKLNSKNQPSYVPTILSDSIQIQGVDSLFEGDEGVEPILIFGYTKDKYGNISNPRIVYYDNVPQWEINTTDLRFFNADKPNTRYEVTIRLKGDKQIKEAK